MSHFPSLFACTLVLVFAACGDDTDNDTGNQADASTSTSGGVQTRGEGCDLTGRAGCMRALTCNLTFTDLELCTSSAVGKCCGDAGTCDEAVQADPWEACADALENQACGDVGTVPAACEALALN